MNSPSPDAPVNSPLGGELIDRIVDGSLSPAELRRALESLEHTPDGWKRCTLAFLEAQCWREALGALGAPAEMRAGGRSWAALGAAVPVPRPPRRWLRGLAAAAAMALSFTVGWLSHPKHAGSSRSADAPARVPVDSARQAQQQEQVAERAQQGLHADASATTGDPYGPALPVPPPRHNGTPPVLGQVVQTVARLRIGPEGAGTEVPILAGPGLDDGWLQAQPPPLSEYDEAVLARHGYRVDQRRRLLSATLADGRRVTVPIDQVQIVYTGNNPL
jgi:hypothetical protein